MERDRAATRHRVMLATELTTYHHATVITMNRQPSQRRRRFKYV